MKRFKNLSLKKKRTLAIAGVSLVTLTIVGTIAYHQDSMFFANIFRAKDDVVEFSETFESPENWQPCQEVPKTAVATNRNDSPRYVRMKINEYWRVKDTQTPTDDHTTTDLPLTWDDNGVEKHFAIINTQNDSSWELKNDGWYYYKTTLAKDESTLSLLKSVTFNCEVNTVGEIRYSVDGQAGESMPNEYAEANYHLYITFQMSDAEFAVEKQRLYTTIAGLSTNIDTDNNRINGINEYSASVNDDYPIYYYRGAGQNNNVIFADKCWLVVRTAERGSTKLLYNGVPNNGACDATGDDALIANNISFSANVPTDVVGYYQTYLTEQFSYMLPEFTSDHNYISPLDRSCSGISNYTDCSNNYYFGKDVSWNEETGQYTLLNTYRVRQSLNNDWDGDDRKKIMSGWRYTCHARYATSCSEVHYWYDTYNKGTFYMITFKNGKKLEDWQTEIFANVNDNNVKSVVDEWYAGNILNGYGDKIEDVVYCNDRRITRGSLTSKDAVYSSPIRYWNNDFAYLSRQYGDFSLDCAENRDSLTTSESNGNGALTYPVAILNADEVMLTNGALSHESTSSYTMTPSMIQDGRAGIFCLGTQGDTQGYCSGVRPVLAVKYDSFVSGGTGTVADPYTLEW